MAKYGDMEEGEISDAVMGKSKKAPEGSDDEEAAEGKDEEDKEQRGYMQDLIDAIGSKDLDAAMTAWKCLNGEM